MSLRKVLCPIACAPRCGKHPPNSSCLKTSPACCIPLSCRASSLAMSRCLLCKPPHDVVGGHDLHHTLTHHFAGISGRHSALSCLTWRYRTWACSRAPKGTASSTSACGSTSTALIPPDTCVRNAARAIADDGTPERKSWPRGSQPPDTRASTSTRKLAHRQALGRAGVEEACAAALSPTPASTGRAPSPLGMTLLDGPRVLDFAKHASPCLRLLAKRWERRCAEWGKRCPSAAGTPTPMQGQPPRADGDHRPARKVCSHMLCQIRPNARKTHDIAGLPLQDGGCLPSSLRKAIQRGCTSPRI